MFTKDIRETPEAFSLNVVSSLTPDLKNKIEQFRATVSDMSGRIRTPEEETQRFEKYCSESDAKRWILVSERNDLIGMTEVYGREIRYDNYVVALGGVGRVRVKEDWRRKGIAEIMMDEAMSELNDLKYDVAFLTTNIDSFLANFYGKYGFVIFNRLYKYLGFSGKSYEEADGMLAPIGSMTTFRNIINGKEQLNIGKGKW